jgi:hypothetical protein
VLPADATVQFFEIVCQRANPNHLYKQVDSPSDDCAGDADRRGCSVGTDCRAICSVIRWCWKIAFYSHVMELLTTSKQILESSAT